MTVTHTICVVFSFCNVECPYHGLQVPLGGPHVDSSNPCHQFYKICACYLQACRRLSNERGGGWVTGVAGVV